jgi:hypothetical protein
MLDTNYPMDWGRIGKTSPTVLAKLLNYDEN